MTISRDPLTRHGVIEAAVLEVGGWAQAADITGRSEKHLRNASNPTAEGRHAVDISLQDVRALTRNGAHAFLDDLSRLNGAHMLPVPAIPATGSILSAVARLGVECGEAIKTVSEAVEDGEISPNEMVSMTRELLEVQRAVSDLISKLKPGT